MSKQRTLTFEQKRFMRENWTRMSAQEMLDGLHAMRLPGSKEGPPSTSFVFKMAKSLGLPKRGNVFDPEKRKRLNSIRQREERWAAKADRPVRLVTAENVEGIAAELDALLEKAKKEVSDGHATRRLEKRKARRVVKAPPAPKPPKPPIQTPIVERKLREHTPFLPPRKTAPTFHLVADETEDPAHAKLLEKQSRAYAFLREGKDPLNVITWTGLPGHMVYAIVGQIRRENKGQE